MRTLNLKAENGSEEVILEQFDEDPLLTVLTVIDSEGNPSTVTIDATEASKIAAWLKEFNATVLGEAL